MAKHMGAIGEREGAQICAAALVSIQLELLGRKYANLCAWLLYGRNAAPLRVRAPPGI